DVLPLHVLGVADLEQTKLSSSELMAQALVNLNNNSVEGGYVVCHGNMPINDFPAPTSSPATCNPLSAAFPVLFPYGKGAMEAEHPVNISLHKHCKQKDFEWDTLALSSITVADLKKAVAEEVRHELIGNAQVHALQRHVTAVNGHVLGSDNARASYQSMIWGTCLMLGGPSLWLTINPVNIHNPITQIFAGEDIDLDEFNLQLGPDSNQCMENVAANPYAAAQYFHFIIRTTLETLFGICCMGNRTMCDMGVLGCVVGYFGVMEAQGRGTLHVHIVKISHKVGLVPSVRDYY
ncbi:hypothetical protein M404DRAFT_154853, partial [Pisolithus tinctorius Marx 270]